MTNAPASAAPTITVIADHDAFLSLMQDLLETEGYRVVTGRVAGDAPRFIRETHPALVILDVVMERQEAGCDMLREMRELPDTAHVPVLLMTAHPCSGSAVRERQYHCFSIGTDMRREDRENRSTRATRSPPFCTVERNGTSEGAEGYRTGNRQLVFGSALPPSHDMNTCTPFSQNL